MLSSSLLCRDTQLQACAVNHASHITTGARGPHVNRIQLALALLGYGFVEPDEWHRACYGASTAAAVLAYKREREIINRAYQKQADDIVGIMTIRSLDTELCSLQQAGPGMPPMPAIGSGMDSAPAFEAKRCLSRLFGPRGQNQLFDIRGARTNIRERMRIPNPQQVVRALKTLDDTAAGFKRTLDALFDPARPSNSDPFWVEPIAGGQREAIYMNAAQRPVDTPFDSPAVRPDFDSSK